MFVAEKIVLGYVDRRTEVCKFVKHFIRAKLSINRIIMSIVRICDLL